MTSTPERAVIKPVSLRVIVCGGRDFTNASQFFDAMDRIHAETPIDYLLHGGARGADTLADAWAFNRKVKCKKVPAQWAKYGKRAGPIRNQNMLGNTIDLVIAFPGGAGTADMVARADKAGVRILKPLSANTHPPDPTGGRG